MANIRNALRGAAAAGGEVLGMLTIRLLFFIFISAGILIIWKTALFDAENAENTANISDHFIKELVDCQNNNPMCRNIIVDPINNQIISSIKSIDPLIDDILGAPTLGDDGETASPTPNSRAAVFSTILMIVVMTLYFVAMLALSSLYSFRKDFFSQERINTLYYMGFIFTLASLGASLLTISQTEKEHWDEHFANVLTENGIAISTTIWGLVLRSMLALGGRLKKRTEDPTESFHAQMRNFTGAMGVAESAVTAFAQDIAQTSGALRTLEERAAHMSTAIDSSIGALTGLQKNADAASFAMKTVHERSATHLKSLDTEAKEVLEGLKQSGEEIAKRCADVLTSSLAEVGKTTTKTEEIINRLERHTSDATGAIQLSSAQQLEALRATAAESIRKVEQLADESARLTRENIETNTGTFESAVEKVVEHLNDTVSSCETDLARIASSLAAIPERFEGTLKEKLDVFGAHLSELAERYKQRSEGLLHELDESRERFDASLRNVGGSLEKGLKITHDTNDSFNQQQKNFNELQTRLNLMQQGVAANITDLSSVLTTLINEINNLKSDPYKNANGG